MQDARERSQISIPLLISCSPHMETVKLFFWAPLMLDHTGRDLKGLAKYSTTDKRKGIVTGGFV